ncbi:mycothiol maleylpyruvate isomerase [Mycobacterium sp. djl-10]|nr:mycothiol maleylpyruvate isomerase [Mycobacterium sp. djl-10]
MDVVTTYAHAARAFTDLVGRIPAGRLDGPGLGDWDLRALIGHTSRSLTTVITYLDTPAAGVDIDGPAQYYRMAAQFAAAEGAAGVLERGRVAGAGLGQDPARAVAGLTEDALEKLAGRGDDVIAVLGGAGMRLSGYLPTRAFELTVHGFDIAGAAGVPFTPAPDAVRESTLLAAEIAVALDRGPAVLLALTGRAALPDGFSVTA